MTPPPDEEAPPTKKPTRLAIGVEGGFDGGAEKVEYEEELSVVVMPERATVSLPNEQLPQKVDIQQMVVNSLILIFACSLPSPCPPPPPPSPGVGLHNWHPGCAHSIQTRSHNSVGRRQKTCLKVSERYSLLITSYHVSSHLDMRTV